VHGALSCRKTNTSPAMLQITGSNSCISNSSRQYLIIGTAEFPHCNQDHYGLDESGTSEEERTSVDVALLGKLVSCRRRVHIKSFCKFIGNIGATVNKFSSRALGA